LATIKTHSYVYETKHQKFMNSIARGTELFNIADKKYRAELLIELSNANIIIPTIYKVFIETYFIGRGKFKQFEYFDNRFNKKRNFLNKAYRPLDEDILVYEFLSLKEITRIMTNENKNFDFDGIDFKKTIPIGECDDSRLLFLGVDSENLDEILIEDRHSDYKMSPIAKNIFDFITDIELFYEDTIQGFSPEIFYKNITEDFWRIKE